MTQKLRWGILATGGIAHSVTRDFVDHGHVVQAVGSRSQHAADAFAAEFGIPHAHGSYEQLAADPEVDVIYIATPHPFHAENAELALNAGKHVLIEKSLTLNAGEARRIVDLAASKNLLLMEAMWTRFLPHVVRIRELIASGTLGDVRSFTAEHAQKLTDDPAHRLNALELGGGALLDLGIYPVSFASHLFGMPSTVQATARFRETGADAAVATVFGYPGGQLATTQSASDLRGANTATIVGTDARMEIDATWYAPTIFRVIAVDGEVLETFDGSLTRVGPGTGKQFQAQEVERLVAAGRTASQIMPPEESVTIMQTMDDIRARIGLVYPGERR